MAITEEELKEMIEPKAKLEKVSTISSDGTTFLTRIPKDIVEELDIKKGDRIRWLVDSKENKIVINLERENGNHKKEKNN
jgi:bifunctional DNA-binding transcriptional regulator/antitoxin component of YhaV-PrlF toxin-antitoxin module